MNIDPDYFRAILDELIEENPLACQGILSIAEIVFTGSVPTLAVTLNDDPPRLLVNLDFIRSNCTDEIHVKALLLHEFLHVLLNHAGDYPVWSPLTNLALDAVINHIIHRSCGEDYSEFCRLYYRDFGANDWRILLAPAASSSDIRFGDDDDWSLADLRRRLLEGQVLADDILDLAREIGEPGKAGLVPELFLGNHDPEHQGRGRDGRERGLSEIVVRALDETFRQLNGDGIFRNPADHGFAEPAPVRHEWAAREAKLARWERTTWKALRPLLTPDPRSQRFELHDRPASLPVLNGGDRRGFLRSLWNPIVPEIRWELPERRPAGTTVVYLDVSGSMNAEMQALVALLNRLRRWIRLPFWAFSDEVVPATIEKGVLRTATSGGTSMNCVLAHLAKSKPEKALVVTDGYIERCDPALLKASRRTQLHALVSRDGNPRLLEEAGISCTQLSEYPD